MQTQTCLTFFEERKRGELFLYIQGQKGKLIGKGGKVANQ